MERETYELTSESGTVYLPTIVTEAEESYGLLRLFKRKKDKPDIEYHWMRRQKGEEPKPMKKASYVSLEVAKRVVAEGKKHIGDFEGLLKLVDGAEKMSLNTSGGVVIAVALLSGGLGIRPSSRITLARRLG